MKERCINLTDDQARAAIKGELRQIRVAVKPQPPTWVSEFDQAHGIFGHFRGEHPIGECGCIDCPCSEFLDDPTRATWTEFCPYPPGTLLWGREGAAWEEGSYVFYRATTPHPEEFPELPWRAARQMPRWASRFSFQVESVRCERVQDVTASDAVACGMTRPNKENPIRQFREMVYPNYYMAGFRDQWDRQHAKKGLGWEANPWVWVINLKSIQS